MAKTKLMMLGPPGAGKGTQAQQLAEKFDIPQISTGDMLRSARRKGTELGKEAAKFMDAGELVPDEVVIRIVKERLSEPDAEGGFILDGFPRTVGQAEALDEMGVELEAVLNIEVSEEEVVRRLGGRLSCPNCGATFHEEFKPPTEEGVCDECGSDLVKRPDDRPEAIRERLKAYHAKTAPLVDYYRDQGVLIDVDGEGTPDEVYGRAEAAISD
ncbi:adenylate kinase [Persicimonas caeni]|uniref:Adenylate kinase n=1 Tax=Persicimonas caeni TaxID=2292766 RepID=A0A4Y6PWG3_PERCE|nr:adenylate kinase [Persicimonas caeni]QDG52656.1 adenylate kinase [Persicimonas caeni]QED33878.1 adenylate kinase [Persicimonas caeni]